MVAIRDPLWNVYWMLAQTIATLDSTPTGAASSLRYNPRFRSRVFLTPTFLLLTLLRFDLLVARESSVLER
ncbi:MAG: hypothetical protein WA804_02470, partial [Terriglobales bacterium]